MKPHFTSLLALLGLLVLDLPIAAQLSPRVKEILDEHNFPELIEQYKQEQVVLKSEGKAVREVAARPYTLAPGFRVQVFAGSARENALASANQVRSLRLDSVYVITTEHYLYKVQMGNFQDRRAAEALLDQVRKAGHFGAWIVESQVHVPKLAPQSAEIPPQAGGSMYYTIQIFATNDQQRAEEVKRSFEGQFNLPVALHNQNTIWKVLVGRFMERAPAEEQLRSLRSGDYSDAWITQVSAAL